MQSARFPLDDDRYNLLGIPSVMLPQFPTKLFASRSRLSLHLHLFLYGPASQNISLNATCEITQVCRPRGGPRFGWQSQAINRCDSGGQPGLYLQREVIEGVFIHGQGLIQKVLSHLEQKYRAVSHNNVDSLMQYYVTKNDFHSRLINLFKDPLRKKKWISGDFNKTA